MKYCIQAIVFLILALLPFRLAAHLSLAKLWTGFFIQKALDDEKKWATTLFSQLRFTNQHQHLRLFFLESSLGYLYERNSIWFGYRWAKHVPRRQFQSHRFFQQAIFRPKQDHEDYAWLFRFRLEEFKHTHRRQVAVRLRQRNNLEILNTFKDRAYFFYKINPLIYDEIFYTVSKTTYTPHAFIAENRLFFGFNFYIDKDAWWEMGYIMQYRSKLPRFRKIQINHVVSLNYFYR